LYYDASCKQSKSPFNIDIIRNSYTKIARYKKKKNDWDMMSIPKWNSRSRCCRPDILDGTYNIIIIVPATPRWLPSIQPVHYNTYTYKRLRYTGFPRCERNARRDNYVETLSAYTQDPAVTMTEHRVFWETCSVRVVQCIGVACRKLMWIYCVRVNVIIKFRDGPGPKTFKQTRDEIARINAACRTLVRVELRAIQNRTNEK